jgi:hypothetical protein
MSHYSNTTFRGLFSVHKHLLEVGHHRFGGSHAQVAYKVSDGSAVGVTLHHSGVNLINAESDTVSVILMGLDANTPAVFSDIEFVEVSGNYQIPSGKYGVLLEGSVTVDNSLLSADEDVFKLDPDTSMNGTAKLLVFTHTQQ